MPKTTKKNKSNSARSVHSVDVPTDVAGLQAAISLLRDSVQPIHARLEALQTIQAASFGTRDFKSVRTSYISALREVAKDDDLELRQRALGILAREHDSHAQKLLLDGLRDSGKALLSVEKTLQLLSYDGHSGAYPLARKILEQSDDDGERREALRLLAADPSSASALESVLSDKNESIELRRMSASALHAMNPERLKGWANRAVLDESEHHDIVATCLTALNQFGDAGAIAKDQKLRKRVSRLQNKAPGKLKHLAKQFVKKYGE